MSTAGTEFSIRRLPGFTATAGVCYVMLYAPILALVAYSFNSGSSIAIWEGFSLHWYGAAWENVKVQEATLLSLLVAAVSSVSATILA